jgi:hypothetical protein
MQCLKYFESAGHFLLPLQLPAGVAELYVRTHSSSLKPLAKLGGYHASSNNVFKNFGSERSAYGYHQRVGRGDPPGLDIKKELLLSRKAVSVVVSVGSSLRCSSMRGAALAEFAKPASVEEIFIVLRFGARRCKVACRDFKSSASAIPRC